MTLAQLRKVKGLNYKEVAKLAGVPLHVPFLAEINGVIRSEDAEKLVRTYSKLHNKPLSIHDFTISIMVFPTHERRF